MSEPSETHGGRCLCGALRFEARGLVEPRGQDPPPHRLGRAARAAGHRVTGGVNRLKITAPRRHRAGRRAIRA